MSLDGYLGLIAELGSRLGVPDMAADAEGYVCLELDGRPFHLQYDAEEDELVVFTRLGEVGDDRMVEIQAMLLGANLFWQGAKGGTFSVDPDTGIVFLADRKAMAGLGTQRLNDWLEQFVNLAEYWAKRIATANAGGPLGDGQATNGEAGPASPRGGDFIVRG